MYDQLILPKTSDLFKEIDTVINKIEDCYQIDVLFSGITNSIPAQLNNAKSDIDLFVIYKCEGQLSKEIIQLFNTALKIGSVEVKMTPFSIIAGDYSDQNVAWGKLRRLWDYNELPGNNNVELSTLLSQIVFGRSIWDGNNYFLNHQNELTRLYQYDYLKRCYAWSKGRLKNYLSTDYVRVRTYLYAIYEISIIKRIIETGNMPLPSFISLIENTINNALIKETVMDLYKINQTAVIDKELVLIAQNSELNSWIMDELNSLKPILINFYKNDKEVVFSDFD